MTRTHWLLAALAAADFLRAAFVMVFVGVSGAVGVWFGGDLWCKVSLQLLYTSLCCALLIYVVVKFCNITEYFIMSMKGCLFVPLICSMPNDFKTFTQQFRSQISGSLPFLLFMVCYLLHTMIAVDQRHIVMGFFSNYRMKQVSG